MNPHIAVSSIQPSATLAEAAAQASALRAAAEAFYEAGRLAEALETCRRLLAADPHSFTGLHTTGLIALRQGRLAEGLPWIEQAVRTEPHRLDAWLNLSRARLLNADADGARDAARAAMAVAPQSPAARLAWACAGMAGQPVEVGLRLLQEAVLAAPLHADGWAELGSSLRGMDRVEEAADAFQRALQVDPSHRAAMHGFAHMLMRMNRFEDAALVFERIVQLWPDSAGSLGHLMHCKQMVCDWLEHDALRQRIAAELVAGRPAAEPFGLQGWCKSPALARRGAEVHLNTFWPDRSAGRAPAAISRPGERIRLGYLGGEFRQQATSVLLTEVLELHDRTRFEVYAFDNGSSDGSVLRRRIEAAVHEMVPIATLDAEPAATAILARGIDLLINLNGFFGLARSDVFALRPARVQVNYLGFPGTMGAPYMDYLVADREVIPPGDESHYREAVVRLPHCYQPNDRRRMIDLMPVHRADVGLPKTGFVFACVNNTYKLTPEVFAVWARLLHQTPGSVLWFFGWLPEAAAHLQRACESVRLDPKRIVPAPVLPQPQHLARLRLADLFLDTFPYNAHTTGSDALWAGLPVLTCRGATFPSRVGASMLAAVGLPELVCDSLEEYEQRALALARDPGRLSALRQQLQSRRESAQLFDTPRYVLELEAAFTRMVERAREGLAAEGFDVASVERPRSAGSKGPLGALAERGLRPH